MCVYVYVCVCVCACACEEIAVKKKVIEEDLSLLSIKWRLLALYKQCS